MQTTFWNAFSLTWSWMRIVVFWLEFVSNGQPDKTHILIQIFLQSQVKLIDWGWVMHISVSKLTFIGSDYLIQCWNIVNSNPRNKFQWNSHIFIQENAFENVCKMAAILPQPQCVNPLRAKFFRGNINIYLYFMSLLHIDLTQILKTLPRIRVSD